MNHTYPPKHRYHVVKSTYQDNIYEPSNGISYGIAPETDPNVCILDISTDLKFVTEVIEKCNEGDLSPIHLIDVVEDALP